MFKKIANELSEGSGLKFSITADSTTVYLNFQGEEGLDSVTISEDLEKFIQGKTSLDEMMEGLMKMVEVIRAFKKKQDE